MATKHRQKPLFY